MYGYENLNTGGENLVWCVVVILAGWLAFRVLTGWWVTHKTLHLEQAVLRTKAVAELAVPAAVRSSAVIAALSKVGVDASASREAVLKGRVERQRATEDRALLRAKLEAEVQTAKFNAGRASADKRIRSHDAADRSREVKLANAKRRAESARRKLEAREAELDAALADEIGEALQNRVEHDPTL